MSREFLNRNHQNYSGNNPDNTVQKKIDIQTQLHRVNNQKIDQGWGIFGNNTEVSQLNAKENSDQIITDESSDNLGETNPKKYQKNLIKAAEAINKAHFGHVNRVKNDLYNPEYWNLSKPHGGLTLKNDKKPSQALKDIISNPKLYSFDCEEFSQIVPLYAMMKEMGSKKFDHYIENTLTSDGLFLKDRIFTIHTSGVSGLEDDESYIRDKPEEKWSEYSEEAYSYESETFTSESKLEELPIGSRLAITNMDAWGGGYKMLDGEKVWVTADPFRNENFVKVGQDQYVAGFLNSEFKIYNLEELKECLAKYTNSDSSRVFLSRIITYKKTDE